MLQKSPFASEDFYSLTESLASCGIESLSITLDLESDESGDIYTVDLKPDLPEEYWPTSEIFLFLEMVQSFSFTNNFQESDVRVTLLPETHGISFSLTKTHLHKRACPTQSWTLSDLSEAWALYSERDDNPSIDYDLYFGLPRVGHQIHGRIALTILENKEVEAILSCMQTQDAGGYHYENDSITQSLKNNLCKALQLLIARDLNLSPEPDETINGTIILDYQKSMITCDLNYQSISLEKINRALSAGDFLDMTFRLAKPDADSEW